MFQNTEGWEPVGGLPLSAIQNLQLPKTSHFTSSFSSLFLFPSADRHPLCYILSSDPGLSFQQCHESAPKSVVSKADLPQKLSPREAHPEAIMCRILLFDALPGTEQAGRQSTGTGCIYKLRLCTRHRADGFCGEQSVILGTGARPKWLQSNLEYHQGHPSQLVLPLPSFPI